MKEKIDKAAEERVTLRKSEVWLLRISAATGLSGMIAHIGDLIDRVF